MKKLNIKNDAGLMTLAIRMVIGWTYFSALWRRVVLADKLDPDAVGYIGIKFNHFLPNALGIKPLIQYLVEHPEALWVNMVAFTIIEGIVGLFLMFGLFTRLASIGMFGLAMGILLGSGWLGTTCIDEWQIGILGIATGFVLFFAGSGKYSLDYLLMKKKPNMTKKRWFPWLASGVLPIKEKVYPKLILFGSFAVLGMALFTNQVFHGGLWGPLHNKSVKPKLEITEGGINDGQIHFDVYRTEGVDVYGAWIIGIHLQNEKGDTLVHYNQKALANLKNHNIDNYYIAQIKPGPHSLIVPLGAKAKMKLSHSNLDNLSAGKYTLTMTDISGASWKHEIIK